MGRKEIERMNINAFGGTFAIHTSQRLDLKLQKSHQANAQGQ